MPFRLKDLMIDVTAAGSALQHEGIYKHCGFHYTLVGCQFIHTFPCIWGCTHPPSYYPPCHNTLPVTLTCPGSLITDTLGTGTILENPGFVKERLKVALAAAEAAEKAQEQSFEVQTVADADLLEQKLAGALEELRARKAELQKQQPGKK